MKNRILFILILVLLLSFSFKVSASESCSKTGYTILTVNGIFTDKNGAIYNRNQLARKFLSTYNNEPLTVDFLYNPSHLAGLGDLVDVVAQGLFDQKSDYDLTEMLNDASQKVTTQKLLLVAHSQGNFYANNFYDKVANQAGGVPANSISVYGVATPDKRVAGDGKYLTSDTDKVISSLAGKVFSIMAPNTHILFQDSDDVYGHSFSDVYLKYRSDRIISDIQSSLNKLSANTIQDTEKPCIAPPKLTIAHKVEGVALAVADPVANVAKTALVGVYNGSAFVGNTGVNAIAWLYTKGLSLAKTIGGLAGNNLALVLNREGQSQDISIVNEPLSNNSEPQDAVINSNENKLTQEGNIIDVSLNNQESQITLPILSTINPILSSGGSPTISNTETATPIIEIPADSNSNNNSSNNNNNNNNNSTPDTTAPVISIVGDNPVTINVGSVYTDLGATAIDDIDGNVVVNKTGIDTIDTTTVGVYTVTYTSTDLSNNVATNTRTVNVVAIPIPPVVVVDTGAKLNRPNFVAVSGNYAYVVSDNSNSLEIIDISNPATPVHKGYAIDGVNGFKLLGPKAVAVSGNYAYVVSYSNALEIIDISNPSLPVHKATLYDNDIRLRRPISITVSGNYAYIIAYGGNAIDIVDISNPINPVFVGISNLIPTGGVLVPSSLFISSNYMYVVYGIEGSNGGGMQIADIASPMPVFKSFITDGAGGADISHPSSIFVSGNYAYIASWSTRSFEVVDISNSMNPVHKAKLTNINFGNPDNFVPNYVFISGNYAYITSWVGETLEIVDISDPSNPIHKASLANGAGGAALSCPSSIFVSGNYAYISSYMSNALEIVDISNPSNPIHKGKISDGEFSHTDPIVPVLSSAKQISSFNFTNLNPEVDGVINENDHTISLTVPFGADISTLTPVITISSNASIIPNTNTVQDFTDPFTYKVTAENGSTEDYIVTVSIAPNPNPGPDITPPLITNYTFNGTAGNITVNPSASNLLSIALSASENVNWTSIKIEKEGNSKLYKYFYSGNSCVDGTNSCTKSWDGELKGGLLQNGNYRIKVNMKDMSNNVYYDYLSPYVITVDTSK